MSENIKYWTPKKLMEIGLPSVEMVSRADFDAEHALRIAAERQAVRLGNALQISYKSRSIEKENLQARLDTAVGLLAKVEEWFADASEWDAVNEIRAFLNTTSTEGKDEYCGDHCTAFDQIEDFTEGKDDE